RALALGRLEQVAAQLAGAARQLDDALRADLHPVAGVERFERLTRQRRREAGGIEHLEVAGQRKIVAHHLGRSLHAGDRDSVQLGARRIDANGRLLSDAERRSRDQPERSDQPRTMMYASLQGANSSTGKPLRANLSARSRGGGGSFLTFCSTSSTESSKGPLP